MTAHSSRQRKLPLNHKTLLSKRSQTHEHKALAEHTSEDKENHAVAFDADYLEYYFLNKNHDFSTVNLKTEKLTSPVENTSPLKLRQIEDVTRVFADGNLLQLVDFKIFPHISILSLRHNSLTILNLPPGECGDEQKLKYLALLDLSHNRLESNALSQLNQLINLTELKLNYNKIRFFTDHNNLNGMVKLERLEMCSNGIESCKIFHHLSTLPCLQELLLNDNHLRCIPLLLRSEAAVQFCQKTEEGRGDDERNLAKKFGTAVDVLESQSFEKTQSIESRDVQDDTFPSTDDTFLSSESSVISMDSDETGFLLNNVYHPQTVDDLESFHPRALSTLYEGSEHRTSISCSTSDHSSSRGGNEAASKKWSSSETDSLPSEELSGICNYLKEA